MTYEDNELNCHLNTLLCSSCFICGKLISGNCQNILDTESPCFGPLAGKLCKIIGNEYLLVISEKDKVCCICVELVNRLEELEKELHSTKLQVLTLLESTYNIHLDPLSMPYNEDIYDEKKDIKLNAACKMKGMDGQFIYSLADFSSPVMSCSELPPQEDFDGDEVAVNINLIPESPANFNDLSKLTPENGLITSIPINIIKEKVVQEVPDDDCSILYSKDYTVYSSSLENPSNDDCAQLMIEAVADKPLDEKLAEEKSIIANQVDGTRLSKIKDFLCEICDIPFSKAYLLMRHKRVHEKSSEKVTCPLCQLECHDRLHYSNHRKNKHYLLNRSSCSMCDKYFPSNKDLKLHLLAAHKGKDFHCSLCGQLFKRHLQLANHKLYSHGKRNCRVCGKQISNVVKLRQHENRHAWIESKNLTCDVCGRSFKTPGGLRVHKVSHTGNYKFFCEFCGKGFMSLVILEEHKGVHTREERYICHFCGRKFVLYSTFHLHTQWHKDPFPFPCKFCKRKFKYRSVRSIHIRREHTGHNHYNCHYCNAQFHKSISLKKHITTHTKEFPYNCNVCFKGFVQRRNLAKHMTRIHNDSSFNTEPKLCKYKVILRPDEFPTIYDETK